MEKEELLEIEWLCMAIDKLFTPTKKCAMITSEPHEAADKDL
ncbi:MAG: hypothetical protein OXI67_14455 [Candidatus Poribacteria bacterium]|nr:hypothetical protein [Candidatus Poribacteria bacterium]